MYTSCSMYILYIIYISHIIDHIYLQNITRCVFIIALTILYIYIYVVYIIYRLPPLPPTPWDLLAEVESRNEMPKFRWRCSGWADWAGWLLLRAPESCWGGQVGRQGVKWAAIIKKPMIIYRLPPLPPTPWDLLAEVESRNEMPKFRWMCSGWADWAGWLLLRAPESCWGRQVGRQGVKWAAIIKKPMIILTFLVKKCQKAMVKLNPEPESPHFYGTSGHPSSKNQW